jgi:serine/threonine-protein kinase
MSQPIRFSRYEVLQHPDGSPHVLGEDTELTIYLAREMDSGAPAVLRVPGPASQRNPAARHRFLEEAHEMSQVKHPHIAGVLHSGDTTAGAFCAMEWCDGVTLAKAIEEVGALPWQEAFRIGLQLASALEALDRCGLVQRGLRPTNIIVSTGADGHAHLKITEYGRVGEDSIRDTLSVTKSGFIRAPAYASPEEFLAASPSDARSLQYSLGAVLWFCLTRGPVFTGSQFEVMFQHVNSEPDWKKVATIPGPALAVLKLLLAKSSADRFASSSAVIAALRSAMAGVTEGSKKLATLDAPTSGPTALAWLKARRTLLLDEVYPFLAQVADLMDTAVAEGSDILDPSLERVHIEIEGWPALPEGKRAALLRAPMSEWPSWKAQLLPLTPSDTRARAGSQAGHFVTFCHRILTGQGKGAGRHVPTAALSAEGNAFFEKFIGTDAARGLSCRGLLEMLSEAEEVMMESATGLGGPDPLATRIVHGHAGAQSAGVANKQEAWLAREREALEHARRDFSAQEAERARRMAEEQAHVEKLRRSLEEQKMQLEEKRREQQRLEQELQLRAQLEFQKLQEEAKARESVLQHKRAAAEDALRQREEEFRLREQERFARLEQLKNENNAMEERVQQEYLTLRHVERRQANLTQSATIPPPPVERKPAAQSKLTPAAERKLIPAAERKLPAPTAAGGIILARLTPLEIPQAGPAARAPSLTGTSSFLRGRKQLVAVLIGLLVAGVLALIGAAAFTMFSDSGSPSPKAPEEESTAVMPKEPPSFLVQPVNSGDSLRTLLNQVRENPAIKESLRPKAKERVAAIVAQSPEEAASSADLLRQTAEMWGMPEAWLALATLEKDEDTKLEYYLLAAKLGNVHARTLAGTLLLQQGVRARHGGIIQQAVSQLTQAAAAGDAEAMMILGEAFYTGNGPAENRVQGRLFIERAAAAGYGPARAWLGGHR